MPITVRDMIRRLNKDGWSLVNTVGSHRQFKHPDKPGRVPFPAISVTNSRRARSQYQAAGRLEAMNEYLVVYERTPKSWGAYVPDLPGCVTTGPSREACEIGIQEAIALHLAGMREDGDPIPPPSAQAGLVKAAA